MGDLFLSKVKIYLKYVSPFYFSKDFYLSYHKPLDELHHPLRVSV